ncbi:hypothetical protein [Paenibacillus sp. OSY-SE]|uniref:hypothetical protein n=1 Tax=Paenibacillus sp. OSY-SE TaxID=1196323 RepID=UPI00036BA72A|nr:hypothetical protein [Paenibacillus sp. OSY-SE]
MSENNEPFMPLTEFYHDQLKRIGESSVVAYLNKLEPFFYWLKHNSSYKSKKVNWDHEPEAIKEGIRQYLLQEMHCKIRDQNNYERIYLTSKSAKTVNLFLAAIKNFYKSMIRLHMYAFINPLIDVEWDKELPSTPGERINKPRLPQVAGTEAPIPFRRQTESYFNTPVY